MHHFTCTPLTFALASSSFIGVACAAKPPNQPLTFAFATCFIAVSQNGWFAPNRYWHIVSVAGIIFTYISALTRTRKLKLSLVVSVNE
jgi:hypothetical protein